MARKMLINGQRQEELRVAIVDNGKLQEYEIEVAESGLTRGNIYRGHVANIEPSLNAAFIDYGAPRHGFLSVSDVVEQAYHKKKKGRPRIHEVLERGKPLLVQVTKDAVGTKGAQLTTNISLAGRYLVVRPYDSKSGVSRKVDEEGRQELQEKGRSLDLPKGFGYIVRTNALNQTKTALSRDCGALVNLWNRIREEWEKASGPRLLYSDQDLIVQAMRDFYDSTLAEVLIDDPECYKRALNYVKACMPSDAEKGVRRYDDSLPLFTRYNLERQIETIYKRKVPLPSGGSIVIDPTEALTAIDVNSSKSTKKGSQDETAYHTNLEAAAEVARQMRLRDIGGLTVVDFIDMRSRKHQREVEKTLKDAMKLDKARVKIGRISPNGLLEINRQRIKQAIRLRTHRQCPTCSGTGHVPSIEMVGLSLLRRIEARAASRKIGAVEVKLHPEVAQEVQNTRRAQIYALEQEFGIAIRIISDPNTSRSDEDIEWISRGQHGNRNQGQSRQTPATSASDLLDARREISSDDDGDDGDQRKSKRRRRRRRGGRGRRGRQENKDQKSADSDSRDSRDNQDSKSDSSDDGRKRRRRRRRRRKDGNDSRDDNKNRSDRSRKSDDDSDNDDGKRKRRRRRRRRRREDDSGSGDKKQDRSRGSRKRDDDSDEDRNKKGRSRRRSRKKDDDSDDGDEKQDRSRRSRKRDDDSDKDRNDKGRSRRRRSRKKDDDSEGKGGKRGSDQKGSDQKGSDQKGSEPKDSSNKGDTSRSEEKSDGRRRRRRRRSRPRPAEVHGKAEEGGGDKSSG